MKRIDAGARDGDQAPGARKLNEEGSPKIFDGARSERCEILVKNKADVRGNRGSRELRSQVADFAVSSDVVVEDRTGGVGRARQIGAKLHGYWRHDLHVDSLDHESALGRLRIQAVYRG